ncbi:hypothetical protein FQR65_LT19995 [Abscondita terminalis]|nr:hypothetical protein FQR65_LT19995 [Abscondita terminalis]
MEFAIDAHRSCLHLQQIADPASATAVEAVSSSGSAACSCRAAAQLADGQGGCFSDSTCLAEAAQARAFARHASCAPPLEAKVTLSDIDAARLGCTACTLLQRLFGLAARAASSNQPLLPSCAVSGLIGRRQPVRDASGSRPTTPGVARSSQARGGFQRVWNCEQGGAAPRLLPPGEDHGRLASAARACSHARKSPCSRAPGHEHGIMAAALGFSRQPCHVREAQGLPWQARRLACATGRAVHRGGRQHRLFVYIPCGVGGAPGGVWLRVGRLGAHVHCFSVEPAGFFSRAFWCAAVPNARHQQSTTTRQAQPHPGDGLACLRLASWSSALMRSRLSGIAVADDDSLCADTWRLKALAGLKVEARRRGRPGGAGALATEAGRVLQALGGLRGHMQAATSSGPPAAP